MFTSGQLCILIVFSELVLCSIILRILDSVKTCVMYRLLTNALLSGVIMPNDFEKITNLKQLNLFQEEKKNDN